MTTVDLLIVGAGPFGLALSAFAGKRGIDHVVLGRRMGFWRDHMPAGMYLRSDVDWHLDPSASLTMERYVDEQGLTLDDVRPLSLRFYLGYADWFQRHARIEVLPTLVERLDRGNDAAGRIVATLETGEQIAARNVALAFGFEYFAHVPTEIAALLPEGRWSHTRDAVALDAFAGRRVLIVGGRQSAFEWAALLAEQEAGAVFVSHRHPSPAFAVADWTWVNPLVDAMIDDPEWFRRLPAEEQQAVSQRMWGEGRLKVEPWLEPRIRRDVISILPNTQITACETGSDGELLTTLGDGWTLAVDHVIFATGYKVDLARVPLLARGDLLPAIATRGGYPLLDGHFETTVPGLFITSLAASQDFGPFFGFTGAVRTSARLITDAVAHDRA